MFEKTLSDLVRGLRAHKANESQYIANCIVEIKKELKQENVMIKANAVSKLTYLQMLGYDISWAAFNIIEVMSSTKFTYKRIGYLAATQSFHEDTDVIMLTTNMIRKDLSSHHQYDAGLALDGLACFMTPDLARDLANDVLTLTTSTKPYIRKRAVLLLYKIFLRFPDALRPAFPRLKEKLEDTDPGVQSAAVSVICELARKNPRNYLSLAPIFFKLLTSSSNNWMLIKIIKLFAALTPLEPRLGKKLVEPLTTLINSTSAMSLLYECIHTIITGMPNHSAAMQLCVSKLALFIEDSDQNLKYLGLLAMSQILEKHPKMVQQHKELIMECLDDRDESIRLRALDLISGMISKKTLPDIVKHLMIHMDQSEGTKYRDELLLKIIGMCNQNNYQYITNFEWYITCLVEMTKFEGTRYGKLIASQMLDVTIRVKDVRPFSVKQMANILENSHLFTGKVQKNGICEVLYAAAWIVGEFSEYLTEARSCLDALLNPKVTALPGHIQAVFVQNIVKLYASVLVKAETEGTPELVEEVGEALVDRLPVFVQSGDLEVQERACCILQLMKYIVKLQSKGAAVAEELVALFAGDLNPVAPKAQKKVPVPEGLDLEQWINEPPSESESEKFDDVDFLMEDEKKRSKKRRHRDVVEDEEEMEKKREARREEQANNPHYLRGELPVKKSSTAVVTSTDSLNVDSIPVTKLDLGISLVIEDDKKKGKKKKRKGKKNRKASADDDAKTPQVEILTSEMPEGAVSSGNEDDDGKGDDLDVAHRALNINLDEPLREDEVLPVRTHRVVQHQQADDVTDSTSKKKKKEKDKHGKRDKKGKRKSHGKAAPADDDVDDEEEEIDGVVGDDEKRKKVVGDDEKRKKKKKHHYKKTSDKNVAGGDNGGLESLIDIGSSSTGQVASEYVGVPATSSDPMLDDFLAGGSSFSEAKPAKKEEASLDDLDFWLSTDKPTAKVQQQQQQPVMDQPVISTTAIQPVNTGQETPEKQRKKHKKGKKDKEKKSEKKSKKPIVTEPEPPEHNLLGDLVSLDSPSQSLQPNIMGLETMQTSSFFKPLGRDDNIELTYETRANPLVMNQVTVAVLFSNKTDSQIMSMEFNVLDSLNAYMIRPLSGSSQESVKVPFELPSGTANECQFMFNVKVFNIPQTLRGTLTYMVKSELGTRSEKLDFKLSLSSSAFICPVGCQDHEFASLLSGGGLCDTKKIKVKLNQTTDLKSAMNVLVNNIHLAIVEQVDDGASLHGLSVGNHHICVLLKMTDSGMVSVSAKGSDDTLTGSLMDEIKLLL